MRQMERRAVLGGITAGLALGGAGALPARARPVIARASYPILSEGVETHEIGWRDMTLGGAAYRLFRAVPRAPAPATGWPGLWMLDGNAAFNRLPAAALTAAPGLALFGIGYPVEEEFDVEARGRDYTPAEGDGRTPEHLDPRNPGRVTGGATAFRARLTGGLRQAAEAGLPLDPQRRVLWGHSWGGLFTLDTLFAAPEAFSAWMAVSPSTDFGNGLLERAEAAARPAPPGTPVRLMLGDSERRSDGGAGPAARTEAMIARLKARPDLEVQSELLEGLGHGEALTASIPKALAFAAALPARPA